MVARCSRLALARLLVLGLLAVVATGCKSASPAETPAPASAAVEAAVAEPKPAPRALATEDRPQAQLTLGRLEIGMPGQAPIALKVEIAARDQERQKGLMFRTQLGEDEGMIFLFPTERYNAFWMHNTLIPLDMFFIDAEWNVVGVVENATPQTDDPRRVDKMSRYVLEVKAGFAARHGLDAGAKVKFMPPEAMELP